MAYDVLIKNGTVIDGTGLPRVRADVALQGSRITAIGRISSGARTVIDAEGMVVSPGIVDLHTHYDAQLLWDPLAACSCWHGVTTVVTGNCGYTLAPCKPEDRDYMTKTFAQVEGVSLRALEAGLSWQWTSFSQYLDLIGRRLGVNVLPYVGHTAVRRFVVGEASIERESTPDEIRAMKHLVSEAMEAGAAGFTTARAPTQVGWYQEPIPSRIASDEEVLELACTAGAYNVGSIGLLPRSILQRGTPEDREFLKRLSVESGRPVIAQQVGLIAEEAVSSGAQVYNLDQGRPLNRVFNLKKTTVLDGMPQWRAFFARPNDEKPRLIQDETVRAALRHDIDHPNTDPSRGFVFLPTPWHSTYVHKVKLPRNKALEGKSILQLSQDQRKHIADVLLDLAMEEGLETQFRYFMFPLEREEEFARFFRSPYSLLGTSDGGAHLERDDGAEYSTVFIRHWVTERRIFTLEETIRLLTFVPASVVGLRDRGLLRPGCAADIMIFDPAALKVASKEVVNTLPGGESRFAAMPEGVKCTIVNGQVLTVDGKTHTGAWPGRVLRLRGNGENV